MKKILLVVAMDSEAEPIVSELNLQKDTSVFSGLPMCGYQGNYVNTDIFLVTNGIDAIHQVPNIGTQAATLSAHLGINHFQPDLVISIGTAGGIAKNGAKPGDIYLSQKIIFFDRRIPLPGFREYGLGAYPSAELLPVNNNLGFKLGIVCSGDSFDDNPLDYDVFIKEQCSAVDMEAAGVAWVSMLSKTPMVAIKGITNYVQGTDAHEQFETNLPVVTVALSRKLKELIAFLSSRNFEARGMTP